MNTESRIFEQEFKQAMLRLQKKQDATTEHIVRLEVKHEQTNELIQKTLSAFIEHLGLSEDSEFMNQIVPKKEPQQVKLFEKDYELLPNGSYVIGKQWLKVMEKLQAHRMNKYYDQPQEQRDEKYIGFYKGMLKSHEKHGSLSPGQFPHIKRSLEKESFIVDPMLGERGTSFGDNA